MSYRIHFDAKMILKEFILTWQRGQKEFIPAQKQEFNMSKKSHRNYSDTKIRIHFDAKNLILTQKYLLTENCLSAKLQTVAAAERSPTVFEADSIYHPPKTAGAGVLVAIGTRRKGNPFAEDQVAIRSEAQRQSTRRG